MGTLVLSGDTSGAITLDAPAVAGSTTQTLVATSGTLAPIVSGTTLTLTNQTAPEFSNIPSWARRITLNFRDVQTNGTAPPLIQIGDSGGIETTGYSGSNAILVSGGIVVVTFSTGYGIGVNTANWTASTAVNGSVTLSLLDATTNTWAAQGNLGAGNTGAVYVITGSKSLSATLDRVRLFIDGTQLFDGGTINILYE